MEGRSGTSETCDSWVDQAKGDLTSDEAEGAAVWLVMFLRDETCKSLEGNRRRRIPTSTCGQDQWSKGTMLHLENTVFVCSPFLTIMSSVASVSGECAVRWCMGVEGQLTAEVDSYRSAVSSTATIHSPLTPALTKLPLELPVSENTICYTIQVCVGFFPGCHESRWERWSWRYI